MMTFIEVKGQRSSEVKVKMVMIFKSAGYAVCDGNVSSFSWMISFDVCKSNLANKLYWHRLHC